MPHMALAQAGTGCVFKAMISLRESPSVSSSLLWSHYCTGWWKFFAYPLILMDVHPVLHQPPSQPFSVLANSYIIIVDAMQASRALITMLVVVASAFAPVLSAPLECVVVPFISCYIVTADLFVVLVNSAKCTTVRNEDAVHFFLSLRGSGLVNGQCMYVLWLDCNGTPNVLHDYPRYVFNHISLPSRIPFTCELLLLSSMASHYICIWTSNHTAYGDSIFCHIFTVREETVRRESETGGMQTRRGSLVRSQEHKINIATWTKPCIEGHTTTCRNRRKLS